MNAGPLPQRQRPEAVDAERAVLGSALISTKAVERALRAVTDREFVVPAHRAIYIAIANLARQGKKIDALSVGNELDRKGWLERANGRAYLDELIDCSPVSAHVETYAADVVDAALLRDLIDIGQALVNAGYEAADDPDEVIATYCATLHAIAKRKSKWEIIPADTAFAEQAQELEDDAEPPTIPLNIADLDALLFVHPGDLIILAGESSAGKSATALYILSQATIGELPSMLATFEMSKRQCLDRLLAANADIPLTPISKRKLTPQQKTETRPWSTFLRSRPLHIVEKSGGSVEAVCAMIRESVDKHGTKLVVLDQLNRIKPKRETDNERRDIDYCIRLLKDAAMEYGIAIILLHQLKRPTGPPRRPVMEDLRGSGAIEQDSDAVLFAFRPDKRKAMIDGKPEPDESRLEIINGKQRNGPTNWTLRRTFRQSTQRIFEASTNWGEDDEPPPAKREAVLWGDEPEAGGPKHWET